MNKLENYFQSQYRAEQREIIEVKQCINEALETLCMCQVSHNEGQWPYCIHNSETPYNNYSYPEKISQSTSAMILGCLAYAGKYSNISYGIKSTFPFFKKELSEDEKEKIKICVNTLYFEVLRSYGTKSGTYGNNDPLSLCWQYTLLDLHNGMQLLASDDFQKLENCLLTASHDCLQKLNTRKFELNFGNTEKDQNVHSFLALKFYHLHELSQYEKKDSSKKKDFFSFFEQRMHIHLSYYDIPDSRFDPAELVFSLEGAILSGNENSLSDETIDRALKVIAKCQQTTPYWRPINPIYATKQGTVLLPLSVEVANSILRICNKIYCDSKKESPFSRYIGMFQRYFRWLKANKIELSVDGKTYKGWESEHVGTGSRIHTWQTSQIAMFLMSYANLLQNHIGDKSLQASSLKVNDFTKSNYTYDELESKEPLLELGKNHNYRIYDQIKKNFIKPRLKNKGAPYYSMLLYGPPGTGKTSVAEDIAKTLKYKLITVTPSDFLAGGEAEVEARAKAIFKCLEEQQNTVVLFDEIDHFLLDRDSEEYHRQTAIFQFMTPGMLPKFNDLRKKANCIFIIATNYAERIDPAIKRFGRIDVQLMLLPPAQQQRVKIIKNILKGSMIDSENIKNDFIMQVASLDKIVTYGDLQAAKIKESFEKKPTIAPHIQSSINLSSYEQRFKKEKGSIKNSWEKTPIEECLTLAIIQHQNSLQKNSASIEKVFAELKKWKENKFHDNILKCSKYRMLKKIIQKEVWLKKILNKKRHKE